MGKVQSNCLGETSVNTGGGTLVGCWSNVEVARNCYKWSAVMLSVPGKWVAVIWMSICATKYHKHRRRCIANLSLDEPLLIAMTRFSLSHWKFIWCFDSCVLHTMQVNRMGINSLAIIPIIFPWPLPLEPLGTKYSRTTPSALCICIGYKVWGEWKACMT